MNAKGNFMDTETYEEAVRRTGRRWPYRTPAWLCPACRKAEFDLDVEGEKVQQTIAMQVLDTIFQRVQYKTGSRFMRGFGTL